MSLFSPSDVFLVTGASSGIGRAIALALNAEGALVVACGRNAARLEETANMAKSPDMKIEERDLACGMDALPAWLTSLAKKYGRFKGMVCSAGITLNAPMSYYDMGKATEVFNICCHASLKLGGAFCSPRVNSGPQSAIVFIAAAAAVRPNPGQGMYAAAKGALVAGANCLALEAAPKKIRVNCISPGLVEGPMLEATQKQLGSSFLLNEAVKYPLGLGQPQNVADLAVFLLSDKASWLTGQNILLAGGR